jgi:hypothetical protein
MNDPMEGFYHPTLKLRADMNYKKIARKITDLKSILGIACFSETKENVLMWTHYAGNYSGICLAYSTDALLNGLPDSVSLVRVAYGDDPPPLSPTDVKSYERAARQILSQKKYNWSYEREWRVLGPRGAVRIDAPSPITHVYFGSRVSSRDRHEVLARLQGTAIEAYAMKVHAYEHTWEPVNQAARKAAAQHS